MNASAPLANLITLGARDLPKLRDFYRALGWPQIMDDGEFVAFELRGIVLALFPLAQLARDGNTQPEQSTGGIRFTIGVNVDSADEVDRLTDQMRAAGARVTKEPVDAEFFGDRLGDSLSNVDEQASSPRDGASTLRPWCGSLPARGSPVDRPLGDLSQLRGGYGRQRSAPPRRHAFG